MAERVQGEVVKTIDDRTVVINVGSHAALIRRAEKEGMSVNSVVNDALAKYLYQSRQEGWANFDSLLHVITTYAIKGCVKISEEKGEKVLIKSESHSGSLTNRSCDEAKASYAIA